MAGSSTSSGGGIGFFGLLAILFIGLKLGGVITWSWLWVLSPLWLPLAILVAIFCLFMAFVLSMACLASLADKR